MNDYFKDCGARTVKFGELTDSLRELQRKISFSDAIYLPGGDLRILTKRIRRIGLIPLLKQYKGIIVVEATCRLGHVEGMVENSLSTIHLQPNGCSILVVV